MKKIFIVLIVFSFLALGLSLSPVFAKSPSNNSGQADKDIPEQDGIYDVPGHPELKVRVFVHKAKPGPNPTPVRECGLADPDSDAVVAYAGWKLPSTFTYNLNPNSAPILIGSADAVTITENAFNAWTSSISGKVSIVRGANTIMTRKALDGKNIVIWGAASGSALGITYIWYNPSTDQVVELDTILNTKFLWTWSGSSTCAYTNSYDAQAILTHELGHWFGLDDHYTSDYENNTMFGYGYKRDAKADTPTGGDIDGLKAIYPNK